MYSTQKSTSQSFKKSSILHGYRRLHRESIRTWNLRSAIESMRSTEKHLFYSACYLFLGDPQKHLLLIVTNLPIDSQCLQPCMCHWAILCKLIKFIEKIPLTKLQLLFRFLYVQKPPISDLGVKAGFCYHPALFWSVIHFSICSVTCYAVTEMNEFSFQDAKAVGEQKTPCSCCLHKHTGVFPTVGFRTPKVL